MNEENEQPEKPPVVASADEPKAVEPSPPSVEAPAKKKRGRPPKASDADGADAKPGAEPAPPEAIPTGLVLVEIISEKNAFDDMGRKVRCGETVRVSAEQASIWVEQKRARLA